jgi:ELWxxDGT repeat protein
MPGRSLSPLRVVLLVVLLAAAAASLRAQTASLVRDLSTGATTGSLVGQLTAGKGKVFFVTEDLDTGRGLWVSDGTAPGTRLLLDSCAGGCRDVTLLGGLRDAILFLSAGELWRSDGTRDGTFRLAPNAWTSSFLGGALYFTSCTGQGVCTLSRTDGTPAGTAPLPIQASVDFANLTNDGHRLFFTSTYGTDPDLWASDGTAAGTARIAALSGGGFQRLTNPGEPLFFTMQGASGLELRTSDGTSAGTRALGHFSSLRADEPMRSTGGRIYFIADDGVTGQEIWTSDGTPAGTLQVTDFALAEAPVGQIHRAGSRAVFAVSDAIQGDRLWASQGSPAATGPLASPCTDCPFVNRSTVLQEIGSRVLFFADDGAHGAEPWITDGTSQSTRLVADLCPGSCGSADPLRPSLLPISRGALFLATDGSHGEELWRTDGTASGTARLTDLGSSTHIQARIVREETPFDQPEAVLVGDTVYFSAVDSGPALWASERPGTTRRVAVVRPRGPGSDPFDLTAFGGKLLFSSFHAETALWSSQGTAESTAPLSEERPTQFSSWEPTEAGGLLFLRQVNELSGAGETALWRTDGTAPGTFRVKSGGVSCGMDSGLTAYQGQLYFSVSAADHQEIWRSDGTEAGTVKAFDLPPGFVLEVHNLTGVGADLYFIANQGLGWQMWKSDGTAAGTRKLCDLEQLLPRVFDPQFRRIGSRTVFRSDFVWTTDGTPEGTVPLLPAGTGARASDLTVFQGSLYFFARTATARGLWRSDGTPAGTVLVKELAGVPDFSRPAPSMVSAFGRLWFGADDGIHGFELWQSDGTTAGTRRLHDIVPAPVISSPGPLTFAGGRLFFSATDGAHGFEPWQSDGTAAGTRMVQDIASQAASSFPSLFTPVGDRLYFTADDGISGRELWSLPLSGPAGCQASATALCLQQGRYRVEARWRDFEGHAGSGHAVPLTADTGTFWFFAPTNTEAVVKILDGQGQNGHVWVFYGALSSVEYTLTVTDTQTGLTRQYFNPPGQLASAGDTHGFGPLGANAAHPHPPASVAAPSPLPLVAETIGKAAAIPCQAGPQRLCLNNGRFGVEVDWKDFQNHTGKGKAVPLTGDTGSFWFFDAANIELVVKVLDGRAFNDHFWLFFGALSNVEYTLTVTDSQTGTVRTYKNSSGRFASVADTGAF